jgi:ADP-heptose:LPS heptosyltransferase
MTGAPHVLVARLDGAGDVLLAGPAVRAVAATASRVTFLAGSSGQAAARLLPGVDEVITFDAPWIPLEAARFDGSACQRLITRVERLAVDEAAILTSFHQSPLPLALLLRLAGVGRLGASSVDHAGSLLDVRRRPGRDGSDQEDVHEALRSLDVVAGLGYRLPAGDDGRLAIRALGEGRPFTDPYVVVHPGASTPARGWSVARASALVDLLVERGWSVAVTGGPSEARLTAAVAGAPRPQVVDLGGCTTLDRLAGVLAGAAVVVVGNTGPAHLAAATGTPVASIFAPVVPADRWKPWAVPVALLGEQDIACAGCRSTVCPFGDQPCLERVTPAAVAAAVEWLALETDPDGVPHRGGIPCAS